MPGPTIHAEPTFCAFHARGGMHSADLSLAFAALVHRVFPALVTAASSMFKWAYASVSKAASFLAICLVKRAWFEHLNLYVVCGLLAQRNTFVPAGPFPHSHGLDGFCVFIRPLTAWPCTVVFGAVWLALVSYDVLFAESAHEVHAYTVAPFYNPRF